MLHAVEVKRFELSEKDALLTFLSRAYPDNPRQSDARFWAWHFLENPHAARVVPVWVAKSGERIVGQLGAIPVELKAGATRVRAQWILDLVVDQDFRRRGLGKRLVLAAQADCSVGLGVNTDEQHAPAMLESLGWERVAKIRRYNKLLFPGDAVPEISKHKIARKLVNLAYAPFRPRPNGKLSSPHESDELKREVRVVKDFDHTFDELWRDAESQWTCAVVRDHKLLAWQYRRQPGKRFNVLGLYEASELVGYVVLFFRAREPSGALSKAAITDLCYAAHDSDQIIEELLDAALRLAIERRAGSLVTDVIDASVEAKLQRAGFWRIKNAPQLMVRAADNEAMQKLLARPDNWFLTRGDSDISIFENTNESK